MQDQRSWFARLSSRLRALFGREPSPGRWIEGSAFSWQGWIGFRPFTLPRRNFRLYRPRGLKRFRSAPLIVFIHGCKQTSDELARGTRIADLADANGTLILMPDQSDGANPYRCWNWFDKRTAEGNGEAAIIIAMIAKAKRRFRIDSDRVLVAGLSAGGALAAVLGVQHREVVRAVFTHAGIACGAAHSAYTALSVMKRGPDTDIANIGREARLHSRSNDSVPLCVVQGLADDVVAPRHAVALVRQYLATNGFEVPSGSATSIPDADSDSRDASTAGYTMRTREWKRDGRTLVRLIEIGSLGHAWSGGDASLPFNDASAPDAIPLLNSWLAIALPPRR
ncbi:MAG TPA: PHB depolymerase family esterase [Casimicrobiaceae bacterium]|nr:PHB depolymerase family esterase [Casimicrobiaceae bacterium]